MSDASPLGAAAELQAEADEFVAGLERERAEIAAERAADRERDRERVSEVADARRRGEHGRDWQVLQQRIDLRETTDSDILNGLDHSTEARAVREVMARHFAEVRSAYGELMEDPSRELADDLGELATARAALEQQLARLAALDGDN
jgi:hypothetical protein